MKIVAVVLPASAGGVVIAGARYLARWHSVGPTNEGPACACGSGGARRPWTPWSECGCTHQKVRRTRGGPGLLKGGGPGLRSCDLSAPPGRARDVARPSPQWKTGPDGRREQYRACLVRVAGPEALLQRPGWRKGDQSQWMGPRSHLLWEWRPDVACPLSRGGVAGF